MTGRWSRLLALLLLLQAAGCTVTPEQPVSDAEQQQVELARELEGLERLDEAVEAWQALAEVAPPEQAVVHRLRAAELLMDLGRVEEARAELAGIDPTAIEDADRPRVAALRSQLLLLDGDTYAALRSLPELADGQSADLQSRILEVRATGLLAIGNPLTSVQLRVRRSALLTREQAIRDNERAIWRALERLSDTALARALNQESGTGMLGWLELAQAARSAEADLDDLERAVQAWTERYPGHPAADRFVFDLVEETGRMSLRPQRLALLLPLSGPLAEAGDAVRNGFVAGWFAAETQRPELRIFDSGSDSTQAITRFAEALEWGADLIVGPLAKDQVNALAVRAVEQTPMLLLNYAEQAGGEDVFHFGLLPEDEARQVAELALRTNHNYAVALVPNSAWGERLIDAFSERFESLGGQLLVTERYDPRENDFSIPIQRMLNLDTSKSRYRRLRGILGVDIKFEPRRRQDVDMIFLAANPRTGRLIKPQLKFHRATDVPVYATSHISAGVDDPRADRDLDGVLFTASPWTLEVDPDADYQRLTELWPKPMERYGKLFGLGLDAYGVIPYLRRLRENPEERFPGRTGNLWVDEEGRLHRELLIATFERGRRQLLPPEQALGELGADDSDTSAAADDR